MYTCIYPNKVGGQVALAYLQQCHINRNVVKYKSHISYHYKIKSTHLKCKTHHKDYKRLTHLSGVTIRWCGFGILVGFLSCWLGCGCCCRCGCRRGGEHLPGRRWRWDFLADRQVLSLSLRCAGEYLVSSQTPTIIIWYWTRKVWRKQTLVMVR